MLSLRLGTTRCDTQMIVNSINMRVSVYWKDYCVFGRRAYERTTGVIPPSVGAYRILWLLNGYLCKLRGLKCL